jgi:Lon protease-like protein
MSPVDLPLFPLPVVLFPGTLLPLHIFEPRYKKLVSDIMDGDGTFGLIYHDPDLAGPFMNETGQVGALAKIRKHQLLPNERSLILARGIGRFRIVEEIIGDRPYYQARVEDFGDEAVADTDALKKRRKSSLSLFEQVVRTQPHVPDALPSFKVEKEVSFRLAASARMDVIMQQELLEMRREIDRLDRLDPVFRFGIGRLPYDGQAQA